MPWPPPFSEQEARAAIANGICWSDALRRLGYEPKGANIRTLQKWAREWNISTTHFDPNAGRRRAGDFRKRPLSEVMVENSPYDRGSLKKRLLREGVKQPVCEICGQNAVWRGQPLSMVLDHINGIANDHRLENLRMLCPNCNATLDTHCGRHVPRARTCPACGGTFRPRDMRHRYCSQTCIGSANRENLIGIPRQDARKVERPPYEQLKAELAASNYSAVGRRYGVSDNAVRKWLRFYEREQRRMQGEDAA